MLANFPYAYCLSCLALKLRASEKEVRDAAKLLIVRDGFRLDGRVCHACDRTRRSWSARNPASRDALVPTLTLTPGTVDALGVARVDLLQPTLTASAGRLLQALLVSRGFDPSRTIHVSELAKGGGFVLTQ